ncbi:MAG: hypothetical protein E7334_09770 [Clostridiales bacterium]|nr:hypothetical protein [Clostridiales bacterium]
MNKECAIARDLMPLTIDKASSQESIKYVNEHMENCSNCKNYFDGMKAALPIVQSEQEKKEFDKVAQTLRKKRIMRMCLIAFIGAMISISFLIGWQLLIVSQNTELSHDQYDIGLYRLENDRIVMVVDFGQPTRSIRYSTLGRTDENGDYCRYIDPRTPIIPLLKGGSAGPQIEVLPNEETIDKIYKGYRSAQLVWQKGDPIAKASPEMEEYYKAVEEYQRLELDLEYKYRLIQIENGSYTTHFRHLLSDEESQNLKELMDKQNNLRSLVPEWKR